MPRVEKSAEVTLVVLVYRSLKWLDWVMKGVDSAEGWTKYRWLVVANDATDEVRNDPRITVDWQNEDPNEFYINRIYRAWNEGVLNATTNHVVMLNSDMYPYRHWLDQLMLVKKRISMTVPTSLLVESGRIPSAMPEYVKDFGTNPSNFYRESFDDYADTIRKIDQTEPGRLFMPILVDRQEFFDVGGYPEGNPPGTTGDKDLIRRYTEAGFKHVTAMGSVVYHVQCGEQEWPVD